MHGAEGSLKEGKTSRGGSRGFREEVGELSAALGCTLCYVPKEKEKESVRFNSTLVDKLPFRESTICQRRSTV